MSTASIATNNTILVNWNKVALVHCEYLLLLSELQDRNFVDKLVCRIHVKNLTTFLGLNKAIANFFDSPSIDKVVLLNGLDLFKIYSNELKEDNFIPIFFIKQGTPFCKEVYTDNFEKTHNIDKFYNTRLFNYEPSKLMA